MNKAEFERERRQEQRLQKIGTRTPRCSCCGETHWSCFEEHHIAGRKHDPSTIFICVTCHKKLTESQKEHPVIDPNADPFLQRLAHFLLGLADMLELAAEKLREFAHALRLQERGNGVQTMETK